MVQTKLADAADEILQVCQIQFETDTLDLNDLLEKMGKFAKFARLINEKRKDLTKIQGNSNSRKIRARLITLQQN